ncbi:ribosome-inactivating family protein [Streptomyces sp. NBC_00989]|uniref:ribosome-inactivating family protein n=1 Tax=Streptomyces sp. NBC_00989 TaxID=2903705 RepID=UPI00386EBB0C|nr:hypothetical protein OG714_05380 [Streptomyces sp. NBC_00989]
MTTETQGGLSRRSFLAVMGAAGLLAGGMVAVGAPTAGAAPGANAEWQITSEPADARTGYATVLNAIRQGVSSHRVRPEGGRPVDVTDQDGTEQYISLDLQVEEDNQFIRVFLRRSDMYVMGWRPGTVTTDGGPTWRNFFTLESDVDLPGAVRTGTGANVNTRFEGLSNYSDLANL